MNSQRWSQIEELYYSALPLGQRERRIFIEKACSDSVLREEVSSLLESDESSGDFLETSILQMGLRILVDSSLRSAATETECEADKPVPDKLLGTTVGGRYEIVEKLGSGGVGDVYRARDRNVLFRTVVVKVLKDSSLNKPWIVAKFQQEIEALTKISDPGVVGIFDAGWLPEGKPYLVMELVEGCNLREFIQRNGSNGSLDLQEIAEIVRQVGRTITSAHAAKVVHRDLKPANIMIRRNVSGDLQVKVIDFGIAKIANSAIGDVTTTGLIAGTVYYMAPEQLLGRKVTASSDIYALGVIAYELVTGRRPFNPESPAALPDLQRVGVKVLPKHLRPALPTVAQNEMLKALSWLPADRHQSARDFGGALAEALNADDSLNETATNEVAQAISAAKWPATVQSRNNLKKHLPRLTFQKLALAAIAAVGVGVLLVMAFSSWTLNSSNDVAQLTYSLTVQKMRNDKEHESPFQSAGNYIFETGYRFRVNARPHQAGYFYIFNEGPTDEGSFSLTLIYPIPSANGGSARVEAAQPLQTDWNQFAGGTGTEQFWIVWSGSPVSELEMARDDAFKNEKGAVTDPALGRIVREFLLRNSAANLQSKTDTVKEETTINAGGDLLVKLLELKHR